MRSREDVLQDLRALRDAPEQPGAQAAYVRLVGELERLRQAETIRDMASGPARPSDSEADAIATWPPQLRARLRDGAASQMIYGWNDQRANGERR